MDLDLFDSAACPAADLTARLIGELAQATRRLADAEEKLHAAAAGAGCPGLAVPFQVRRIHRDARRQVHLLRQVLAGVPTLEGESHVESA